MHSLLTKMLKWPLPFDSIYFSLSFNCILSLSLLALYLSSLNILSHLCFLSLFPIRLFFCFCPRRKRCGIRTHEPTNDGQTASPLNLTVYNIIFLFTFIFVWIILCTHYLIGAIFLKIWIPSLRSSQTCILLFLVSLSLWVLFIFSLRLFFHPLAIAFFSSRSSYCLTTFTLNLFLLYPIPFLLNFLSLSIRFHLFRSLYSPSSPLLIIPPFSPTHDSPSLSLTSCKTRAIFWKPNLISH